MKPTPRPGVLVVVSSKETEDDESTSTKCVIDVVELTFQSDPRMSTCPRCRDKPIRPISLDGSAVYEQRRANRNQSLLEEARVHPGLSGARRAYDADRFRTLIQRFALIGKVGLDLRAGKLD